MRKYDCKHYNRVIEVCDIHILDCDDCKLYQPVLIADDELREKIIRTQGSMRCWEDDDGL